MYYNYLNNSYYYLYLINSLLIFNIKIMYSSVFVLITHVSKIFKQENHHYEYLLSDYSSFMTLFIKTGI